MSTKSLQYYKSIEYTIVIKKETVDNESWYIAYSTELGINACHGIGSTQEEALNSFLFEKNAFIEFLYENGDYIPEPSKEDTANFSGVLSLRTSPWLHSILANQAKEQGVSLNAWANQLLAHGSGNNAAYSKSESKIDAIGSRIIQHCELISKKLNNISYKTDSMFDDSFKKKFEGKGVMWQDIA